MTTTVSVVSVEQIGRNALEVVWTADADPSSRWQVWLNENGAGLAIAYETYAPYARSAIVAPTTELADGDTIDAVRVASVADGVNGDAADVPLTWTVPYTDTPFTYGEIDYLAAAPRYTSLAAVKSRLGVTGTEWDTEITQAIVAAELAMDIAWGRSFPDTGTNPKIPGIPVMVTQAAENVSVAVLKQTDAPFGTAGSDDWFGELELEDEVRKALARSPLLRGFKVAAGFGVA